MSKSQRLSEDTRRSGRYEHRCTIITKESAPQNQVQQQRAAQKLWAAQNALSERWALINESFIASETESSRGKPKKGGGRL